MWAADDFIRRRAIIFACALCAIFFYYLTASYYFPGGASIFLAAADAFSAGGKVPELAQRSLTYPLLLWLSGFTVTDSFIGITAINTVFAAAMPLIIYDLIGREFPRTAFYVSLIAIVAFVPMLFIKMIHHDQAYLFFVTLCAWALSRFARNGSAASLYVAAMAAAMAGITRPAGTLMWIAVLLLALYFKPRRWPHMLICAAVALALLAGENALRRDMVGVATGQPAPSYTGQQFFAFLYMNSHQYGVTLGPQLGQSMQMLDTILKNSASPSPFTNRFIDQFAKGNHYTPELRQALFGFATPQALAQHFWTAPNYEYFEYITNIPSIAFDSDIFLKASWEIVRANPLYPLRYSLRNFLYYFRPGYSHPRFTATDEMVTSSPDFIPHNAMIGETDFVPARGLSELRQAPYFSRPVNKIIRRAWKETYHTLSDASLLLMLFALLCSFAAMLARHWPDKKLQYFVALSEARNYQAPFFVCLGLLLYNALVTAIVVEPVYRYQYYTIMLQFICAGYGAVSLLAMLRQRRQNKASRQLYAAGQ